MPDAPWFRLMSEDEGQVADLIIFGIPYDGAAFFRRGAAEGPDRMRTISPHLPPVTEAGDIVDQLHVIDLGNVTVGHENEPIEALHERVTRAFMAARERGLPCALGGDHSVSIPLFHAAAGWAQKEMGIIWIDAHPDLCDAFQGSRYSHACVLRRALDHPFIDPRNVVMLGVRSFEIQEVEYIREQPITMLTAQHLATQDAHQVGAALAHRFGDMPVYLSLDIDAFDPAFAPGTGIPDAGGLTTRWVLDLIHGLAPLNLVTADVVEVAPSLDVPSDATSLLALKVILELLGNVVARSSDRT
ncbi:MAG: agmatinase [Chloroflexota bacterium]